MPICAQKTGEDIACFLWEKILGVTCDELFQYESSEMRAHAYSAVDVDFLYPKIIIIDIMFNVPEVISALIK